jgi:hypothetical protein
VEKVIQVFRQTRFALAIGLAAAVLTACGGQPSVDGESSSPSQVSPHRPTVNSVTPTSPSNSLHPSINGKSDAATVVGLFTDSACSTQLAESGTAAANGTFSIPITVSANSTTTVYAKAVNSGGLVSPCSTTFITFVQDSVAPVVPTLTVTPAGPANYNNPVVSGAAEAGTNVGLYSDATCATLLGTVVAASNGTYHKTVAVSDNTTTSIYSRATDAAGNSSACSTASVTYVEDSTLPGVPIFVSSTPVSPANGNAPVISGTTTAGATVKLYSDSACSTLLATTTADGSGNFSSAVSVADNSTTTIYGNAFNGVGTPSGCSTVAFTYVEDSIAPATPLVLTSNPLSPSNSNSPAISGFAEAASAVKLYSDNACTTLLGSGTADAGANFAINVTVPLNATTDIYASATDAAGNNSGCSSSHLTYIEDSAAPALPVVSAVSPTGPANNNAPTVTGTAEALATVKLYKNNTCTTQLASGLATAGGTFSIPIAVADNTTTAVYAKALDAAGNSSGCSTTTVSYVEDSVVPALPALTGSTPASPANNNNPSITGTAEAGATVTLFSNSSCSTLLASGTATAGGTFSIAIAASDDTTTAIYATASDAAGNISGCTSSALNYVEDSTAPSAPVITGTTPTSPSTSTSPAVTGTAEASSTVMIFSDSTCSTQVASGTASGAGSFSVSATVGLNSTTTFYAESKDAAGNTSACSTTFATYVQDNSPPAAPVVSGSTPASPANNNNPTVTGTSDASITVKLYSNATCTTLVNTTTASAGGAWSIPVTVADDSSTTYYAKAFKPSGTSSACSAGYTYIEDSTAPVLPVVASTSPVSPANNNAPNAVGTAEAGATVSLYSNSNCTTQIASGSADGSGAFSIAIAPADNTTTAIYAKASDAAGNVSGCSTASVTYVEDSVAPALPVVAASSPVGPANNNTPAITGTAEANAAIKLYSNSSCTALLASGAADGSGNYSVFISVSDNTTTQVWGTATDAAGNVSGCSTTSVSYVEDSVAPAMPAVSGVAPTGPANNNNPVVSGTAAANSTVKIYTDNACTGLVGTGTADGAGNYSVTTTVSDDSSNTFYAMAFDAASNASACSTTHVSYVEDSSAPALPIVASATPAGPANNNSPSISGTAEANATVKLYGNSTCTTLLATGSADGSGNFSFAAAVADNSTNTIYATATDAAGNVSGCSTTSVAYVEDSTPPALPVVTGFTPVGPANNNSPAVTGTAEANATVKIYSNNTCTTLLQTGTANGAGAYSITISVTDNTTTNVWAKATDLAGNTSGCSTTTASYVEDSTKPSLPVFTSVSPAGPANNNNPIVNGTAEANASVKIYTNSTCTTQVATGTASAGGTFGISVAVSDNTSTTFYAQAFDGSGNPSGCSAASAAYVEDSAAPAIPVVSSSNPAGPANNNAPLISGTAEANATVNLYSNSSCTTLLSTGSANGSGNYSIAIAPADNSTTTVYAKATDAAGNVSGCSTTFVSYVEDSTAPALPAFLSTSPSVRSSKAAVTFNGTAEANATVKVYSNSSCTTQVASGAANGSGSFAIAYSAPADQTVTYYATATDAAGNASACSTSNIVYTYYTIGAGLAYLTGTQTTAPGTPTNLNQSTAYSMQWSASDFDYDYYTHSTSSNSHQLTVKQAGNYLVSITLPVSGAVTTGSIQSEIRVNGTAYNAGRGQSSFITNGNGHITSSNNYSLLLKNLAANDLVDVTVLQGGAAGTITTAKATLTVEFVGAGRTIFNATATQTSAGTNLNQASTLQWTDNFTSSGISHSNSSNTQNITLSNAGTYVVHVNLPMTTATAGTDVKLQLALNGTTALNGNSMMGYIPNTSGASSSSTHWSGIVKTTAANTVLTVKTLTGPGGVTGTVTVPSGRVGSIFVESLSSNNNVFFGTGTATMAGTNMSQATASPVTWTSEVIKDTFEYTHSTSSSNEDITVVNGGDYMLLFNQDVTAGSSNASLNMTVTVNGTAVSGDQSNTFVIKNGNTESSGAMIVLLRHLSANDIINITSVKAGRNTTVTDNGSSIVLIKKP